VSPVGRDDASTCGLTTLSKVGETTPVQTGCVWSNERVFNVAGDCAVNQLVAQSVTYILDSAPPLITGTAPFVDYGCAGDLRTVADSSNALVVVDADGPGTIQSIQRVSETRVTNNCQVVVSHLWRTFDCCDQFHERLETYVYTIAPMVPSTAQLCPADMEFGCIYGAGDIPSGVSTLGAPISTGCFPAVTFVGDGPAVTATDDCNVSFTRTNRITDSCGNLQECFSRNHSTYRQWHRPLLQSEVGHLPADRIRNGCCWLRHE